MTLRQDIAAILADDTKTEAEKTALIYDLKVDAIVSRLQAMVGQQWIVNNVTHRIPSSVPANGWTFEDPLGVVTSQITKRTMNGTITLVIVLQRTGATFNQLAPAVYVNPPVAHNFGTVQTPNIIDVDAMSAAQLATFGRTLIAALPPVT